MVRKLRHQRRGKGSPKYRATKTALVDAAYLNMDVEKSLKNSTGAVVSLKNDSGRTAVIAEVELDNGMREFVIAAEGLCVGDRIEHGEKAEVKIGNILPLEMIPEGCPIFNIERIPGDGGSFVKASGIYAFITTKDENKSFVKLPSTKVIALPKNCRATIGCVAGGGRIEKPFVKAGNKFHAMKARKRVYPKLRGVAMNAIDHPFGGAQHHAGKSKSTSRHAAPGRKVGAIASRRTGRRKKN